MFKKLLSNPMQKISKVSLLEFDDPRERAIYKAGIDAGERQTSMQQVTSDLLVAVGMFVLVKTANFAIKKFYSDEGTEGVIDMFMEEEE